MREKHVAHFKPLAEMQVFFFPFANLLFLFQNTSDMVQRKRFLLMVCTLKGSARVHAGLDTRFFSFSGPLEHMGIVKICPPFNSGRYINPFSIRAVDYVYHIGLSPN